MYNTVNMSFTAPWTQVQTWAQQQDQKIETSLAALEAEREEVQRLLDWISSAEEALSLRDQEPPAETTEQNQDLIEQHTVRLFSLLWPFSLPNTPSSFFVKWRFHLCSHDIHLPFIFGRCALQPAVWITCLFKPTAVFTLSCRTVCLQLSFWRHLWHVSLFPSSRCFLIASQFWLADILSNIKTYCLLVSGSPKCC